jgi:site-specific DNA-methyltransferase (adenine-specific)/adenine-specific DNA-methyltransferase
LAVNDAVEAVGFDFIRRPELDYETGMKAKPSSESFIRVKTFKSEAQVREPLRKKVNLETLSMVMLDYDFDSESDLFELDAVFYADAIEKLDWEVRFPVKSVGQQVMAVFVDIHGNEARELIPGERFTTKKGAAKAVISKPKPVKKGRT